ncbi:MAG: hypothetical protein ABI758_00800 [Candidatus Woesebacteria bacterium]
MKTTEQQTTILLPSGEWLNNFIVGMKNSGFPLEKPSERSLSWTMPNCRLPILFKEVRASDVPVTMLDSDVTAKAGFTGSDIVIESGLLSLQFGASGQDRGEKDCSPLLKKIWNFPTDQLVPTPIRPRLAISVDPQKYTKNPKAFQLTDLRGTTVYTSFPRITQTLFDRSGVNAIPIRIKERRGKIEALPSLDRTSLAEVDIINTGRTQTENELVEAMTILESALLLLVSADVNQRDEQRIDDFIALVNEATKKERMV